MFQELNEYLSERFEEVEPYDFYREIFPAGELEKKGEQVRGKYTAIIISVRDRKQTGGKPEIKRYAMYDDLQAVDVACASDEFCLCSPLSYAGKSRTADHARMLYAIAVDVDRIRTNPFGVPVGLGSLWERHIEAVKRIPKPTFIVSSGAGLHLYYVLERPVPLFRDTVFDLQEYKRELTRLIWHDTIVNIRNAYEIQQEGIFQGFRMPGTVTKYGDRAIAFRTGEKVTIEYLNSFVGERYKVKTFTYKSKLTRAEAEKKYPDWYERRIKRGEKRGAWAVNRAVYDWWLDKIKAGATVGHRYYCMMTLAMYARKCAQYSAKQNPKPVTRAELEADCFSLLDRFEALTNDDANHFGSDDVLDALEAFNNRWVTYPRRAIEYRSGITIPPNKRNGRDQETHLKVARAIQGVLDPTGQWRVGNGRKSKRDEVQAWRSEHPNGTKAECMRDTGISRATVFRHWE